MSLSRSSAARARSTAGIRACFARACFARACFARACFARACFASAAVADALTGLASAACAAGAVLLRGVTASAARRITGTGFVALINRVTSERRARLTRAG